MILSLAVRCFILLLGYVAANKIDLKELCDLKSFRCTISDCNDELLVIDDTKTKYNFTELVFRNCYLLSIPPEIFSITPKLELIVMYKCSTRSLQQKTFLSANNLRLLYLPNNRLTELPEKIFANLSAVEEIRLNDNHISHIHPKAFAGLTKLRLLELNRNKLHELASGVFNNLTNLEYLDLSYNDIQSIDSKLFETNLQLNSVYLSNNNFAVFESDSFAHLPHLKVLDISYNTIAGIRLQSVDTLYAQNSQLRSCVINGSVIRIRAGNNLLASISITDKSSVREIDLHTNQFDSMFDFHGMQNLQKLEIAKNFIQSLNGTNTSLLLDLPSLQYLNVANGQLQSLKVENFMLLGKLMHLDMASNNLQELDVGVFEPLHILEKLYFEKNRLRLFEYETLLLCNPTVIEMGIFGNDWSQPYLKKMSNVLKANGMELVIRFNPTEASEMLSLQTTSHPHHTVHAKTLDHSTGGNRHSGMNTRDVLIIVTLCLVLIILILQLFRIFKDENVFALFNQRISRTIRSTRLDEEESEPL